MVRSCVCMDFNKGLCCGTECVPAVVWIPCVRAFVSEKFPSLNNLLTSLLSSIHGSKKSFSLTAVGLCTEFPLFSLSADQSICPSSVEQRCRIWKRDKTNRTNALPLEHGVTYIGKSMIKSQKESLFLEDSVIPSPSCICRPVHTNRINRPCSCGSRALKIHVSVLLTNATRCCLGRSVADRSTKYKCFCTLNTKRYRVSGNLKVLLKLQELVTDKKMFLRHS